MTRIPPDAYVLIIGAMKAGTSSLFNYLVQHRQICPSIRKEPEFFSEHQGHRYNGVTRYEELWDFDPAVHRYALEASTGYTKYPSEVGVPKRMHDYGIRPKFIYLVRNPFDRIRSEYEHLAGRLNLDVATPWSMNGFVKTSNYFLQLEQYRPYFPQESFLILDFDELGANPRKTVLRVCQFLGISEDCIPTSYPVHHRTLSHTEMLINQNSVLRRVATMLPGPVRRFGKEVIRGLSKRREWTKEERDAVERQLTNDMYRFQEVYGFDVSNWGWDKAPAGQSI